MNPSQNDSFGSFSQSAENQNGVVFGGGLAPRRFKRGVIIGVIVAILVVVAIIVALVYGMRFMKKSGAKFKDNFYQFANYVLYGEDSTVPIDGTYSDSFEYYFLARQYIADDQLTLYEKTGELLSRLEIDDAEISKWIDVERRLLSFMDTVYTKKALGIFDIEDKYLEKASLARDELINYYGVSTSEDNEYMQEFLENFTVLVDAKIKEIEIYYENGCLSDEVSDFYCLEQKADEETLAELEENEEVLKSAYGSYQRDFNLARNFVANVFWINSLVEVKNE